MKIAFELSLSSVGRSATLKASLPSASAASSKIIKSYDLPTQESTWFTDPIRIVEPLDISITLSFALSLVTSRSKCLINVRWRSKEI